MVFFPLQATRDTFLNWGVHLCAPTFAHLSSCGLSSVHISTGNITAGFPLPPPHKGEGKLIADSSLSLPSQVKVFIRKIIIWLAKLPHSLRILALTWGCRSQSSPACACCYPAALNAFPYPSLLSQIPPGGHFLQCGSAGCEFSTHLWVCYIFLSFLGTAIRMAAKPWPGSWAAGRENKDLCSSSMLIPMLPRTL